MVMMMQPSLVILPWLSLRYNLKEPPVRFKFFQSSSWNKSFSVFACLSRELTHHFSQRKTTWKTSLGGDDDEKEGEWNHLTRFLYFIRSSYSSGTRSDETEMRREVEVSQEGHSWDPNTIARYDRGIKKGDKNISWDLIADASSHRLLRIHFWLWLWNLKPPLLLILKSDRQVGDSNDSYKI